MSIHLATSHSKLLLLPQLAANPQWTMLSKHRHACNLMAADGTLVALVNEIHGNGPFHIVVPGIHFEQLPPTTGVRWQGTQLQLAQLTIDWRDAIPWDPQLPQLSQMPPEELSTHFGMLATTQSALYSGPPALTVSAQRGIYALRQGVITGDAKLMAQGAAMLGGLGPGLTPAGDDFLVGMVAGIWARYRQDMRGRSWSIEIANAAANRTTRLSETWLAHAGKGAFGEQWHHLVRAINRCDNVTIAQAMKTILHTGASSGADALCGFFAAILS